MGSTGRPTRKGRGRRRESHLQGDRIRAPQGTASHANWVKFARQPIWNRAYLAIFLRACESTVRSVRIDRPQCAIRPITIMKTLGAVQFMTLKGRRRPAATSPCAEGLLNGRIQPGSMTKHNIKVLEGFRLTFPSVGAETSMHSSRGDRCRQPHGDETLGSDLPHHHPTTQGRIIRAHRS